MKLSIGDKVSLSVSGRQVSATVEDASKGDEIQAKVETSDAPQKYEVGKVYVFLRNDIQESE